jgi:pentapeptide MXKDX repeat protein
MKKIVLLACAGYLASTALAAAIPLAAQTAPSGVQLVQDKMMKKDDAMSKDKMSKDDKMAKDKMSGDNKMMKKDEMKK